MILNIEYWVITKCDGYKSEKEANCYCCHQLLVVASIWFPLPLHNSGADCLAVHLGLAILKICIILYTFMQSILRGCWITYHHWLIQSPSIVTNKRAYPCVHFLLSFVFCMPCSLYAHILIKHPVTGARLWYHSWWHFYKLELLLCFGIVFSLF